MPHFTPGPWAVDECGFSVFSRSGDCTVAEIEPANSDEEIPANARLIAEAPEMYRALKECADFIEDIICRNCEDCSLKLDAEGLREYLECIFARIDGTDIDKEEE